MGTFPRVCEQCGQSFTASRAHARFCSPRCRVAWNRAHPQGEPTTVTRNEEAAEVEHWFNRLTAEVSDPETLRAIAERAGATVVTRNGAEATEEDPSRVAELIADRDTWRTRYLSIKDEMEHDNPISEGLPPRAGGTLEALDRIAVLANGVAVGRIRRREPAAFVRRVRKADREDVFEKFDLVRMDLGALCDWLDEAKAELDAKLDQ